MKYCPNCKNFKESDSICPDCKAVLLDRSTKECPICGQINRIDLGKCIKCKYIFPPEHMIISEPVHAVDELQNETINQPEFSDSDESLQKYPTLRTLSSIFYFSAWIIGLAAMIGIVIGLTLLDNWSTKMAGITLIISSCVGGFWGIITSLAFSEIIKVFVDIEFNTRK